VSKILVVAAHPDDEVLGCGGTIARMAAEGRSVAIAILGEGITSRYDRREEADGELLRLHRERCQKAADMLGAKELFTYDLPDNRFDQVPLLEVAKIVEGLVDKVGPEEIYTHHGGDLNIDHVVVHRAVMTATRPVAGQIVREVYAFEVPSSTEWAFGQFTPVFRPSVFVEVDTFLERKVAAMQCYESEAREFPHPRSPEALRAIAQRWGATAGLKGAEAFELIRSVRA
jgi:LmbE family N-acetylglucosaminyl deacetylase